MVEADTQKERVLRAILVCSTKWMSQHLEKEAIELWAANIQANFQNGPAWNEVKMEMECLLDTVKTILRMEADDYDS